MKLNKLNITVITASVSRRSGGVYAALSSLCKNLSPVIKVFGLKDEFTHEDSSIWGNLNVVSCKINGIKSFGFSKELNNKVLRTKSSLVHLHGIWMYPQWVALNFQNKLKKPVIISPHGMLDPWAIKHSNWKKKIVGLLFANQSLNKANCIHALCESEYQSIRLFGLKNPVAIIPNGINIPENQNKIKTDKNILLFIGRIHPKKGLENLIEAIKLVKDSFKQNNWELHIAGWSEVNHEEALQEKVKKFNLQNTIKFVGPVYGDKKEEMLLKASAFILPSYSEGLPMSVLEAWSYKLPVLMTEECNIPEGFHHKAAIKLELNPSQISESLKKLFELPIEKLESIGTNGYELVSNKFTWEKIAQDMEETYSWLINGGAKPEFVILD